MQRNPDRQAFPLRDGGEMSLNEFQRLFIHRRRVPQGARITRHVEHRGVRGGIRQRRDGGVHRPDSQLDRFQAAQGTEPGVAVCVKLDRYAPGVLKDHRDQCSRTLGREQPSRIFQADPVNLQRGRVAGLPGIVFIRMSWRNRVDQIDYRLQTRIAGCMHMLPPDGDGVGRVGYPDLTYSMRCKPLDAEDLNRFGRDLKPRDVPAPNCPQRCLPDPLANQPDPLPRILAQLTDALLDESDADHLDGLETSLVHLLGDGQYHARPHSHRPQTRLPVAQRRIDEAHLVHIIFPADHE